MDGVLTLVKREKEQEYYNICKEWEEKVGNTELGKLEYTEYEFIIQESVNHYLAKKVDGTIKRKGSFMIYEDYIEDNWHKNPSGLIIPLAIQKYLIDGIPIEKTVKEHDNIHDFTFGVSKRKTPKKGDFKWLISEVWDGIILHKTSEERFMRFYVTNDISSISKLHNDGSMVTLNSEASIKECQSIKYLDPNKLDKQGNRIYNINFDYYINKAQETLNKCHELDLKN